MGKGKGKKGARKGDLKKKKEPKIKALASTKPPNPVKIANKLAAKAKREARLAELKAAIAKDPSLLKPFDTPMQRTETFMKNPNAAKWPHLFKRQLGLIEMHIDSLTRIMQGMKNDGNSMSEKDKLDWELGERGNWRAICGMMDRARLVMSQTKEAAQGVLPSDRLADKKKLGLVGTTFVPLVPQLDEKARQLGYNPKGKGSLGRSMDYLDQDGDSEMSDASDSSGDSGPEDDSAEGDDFIKLEEKKSKKKSKKAEDNVQQAPLFFVDTEPTPVNITVPIVTANPPADGLSNKQRKKIEKDAKKQERLEKRMAKKASYEAKKAAAASGSQVLEETSKPESESPKVDFRALEAKLQAEIADGTKAQEEAEAQEAESAEKRAKKKRRRSGEGGEEVVEKRAKKDKKEKNEKKEKKRKADDEDVVEDEVAKKKKRKQKSESDSD